MTKLPAKIHQAQGMVSKQVRKGPKHQEKCSSIPLHGNRQDHPTALFMILRLNAATLGREKDFYNAN